MLNPFTYLFRNLDDLDVQPIPRRAKVVKDDEPGTTKNPVTNGAEWQVEITPTGFVADKVVSSKKRGRFPSLDGWDTAYLRESFTRNNGSGKYDETIARILKSEWATPVNGEYPSNADLERMHTGASGATQEGYSLRNIKKYTWAFLQAQKAREAE